MKHYALALALLAPCGGDETEATLTVGDASTPVLISQADGATCVNVTMVNPDAGSCPKPVETQKFTEACLPSGSSWASSHTFQGVSNLDVEARVSVLCVKSAGTLGELPDFPFETLYYMSVTDSTVKVSCGFSGANTPNCSQVVFYLRGQ